MLQEHCPKLLVLLGKRGQFCLHLADRGVDLPLDHLPDAPLHPFLHEHADLLHLRGQDCIQLLLHALLHYGMDAHGLSFHSPIHLEVEVANPVLHILPGICHLRLHPSTEGVICQASYFRVIDGFIVGVAVDLLQTLDPQARANSMMRMTNLAQPSDGSVHRPLQTGAADSAQRQHLREGQTAHHQHQARWLNFASEPLQAVQLQLLKLLPLLLIQSFGLLHLVRSHNVSLVGGRRQGRCRRFRRWCLVLLRALLLHSLGRGGRQPRASFTFRRFGYPGVCVCLRRVLVFLDFHGLHLGLLLL
mmetsp:Transcript_62750/g.147132  ORF Transcript_62750/g.147132 Transcript_62750/m.147132 type:complete len:303 (+) Transcript_62750:935-1843(+)